MAKQIKGTSGTTYIVEGRREDTLPTHSEVELALSTFAKDHGLTDLQERAYWFIVRQWAMERPEWHTWKVNPRGYLLPPAHPRRFRGSRGVITAKTMEALVRKGMLERSYTRDADGKPATWWRVPDSVALDPTPLMAAMCTFIVNRCDVRENDFYWTYRVSGSKTPGDGGGNRGNYG